LPLCLLQERLPYEGTRNSQALSAELDPTCLLRTWRILGAMACPWECVWVENAYPCGILEVVRQPGRSHLAEFPRFETDTTGGHNLQRLQYAEARVFTWVPQLGQDLEIPIAAPGGPSFMVSYVSELDRAGWRAGLLEFLRGPLRECAGAWGCVTPRTGFLQHQSEPIAAHLQALRAGKTAAAPLGRVVTSVHPYEPRTGHFLQQVAPAWRPAVSIGFPDLARLETGTLSPHGAYLFVQWGIFQECSRCLPATLMPPRAPVP
jgi:hypothetical protein